MALTYQAEYTFDGPTDEYLGFLDSLYARRGFLANFSYDDFEQGRPTTVVGFADRNDLVEFLDDCGYTPEEISEAIVQVQ